MQEGRTGEAKDASKVEHLVTGTRRLQSIINDMRNQISDLEGRNSNLERQYADLLRQYEDVIVPKQMCPCIDCLCGVGRRCSLVVHESQSSIPAPDCAFSV